MGINNGGLFLGKKDKKSFTFNTACLGDLFSKENMQVSAIYFHDKVEIPCIQISHPLFSSIPQHSM